MVGCPPAGGQASVCRIKGRLAEWLGIGLQNRVRRFESATDLNKIPPERSEGGIFCFQPTPACEAEGWKQKRPETAGGGQGFCCTGPPSADHASNPPRPHARRRDGNKKDRRPPAAVRDFVAQGPPSADHASNPPPHAKKNRQHNFTDTEQCLNHQWLSNFC
jgi:hypothetical protein